MCVHCVRALYSQRSEEGIGNPETGVSDCCKPSDHCKPKSDLLRATRALNSLTNCLISCMKNIFAKMFLCTNCQLILLFRYLDIIIWHHFLMYKQDDYTLQLSGRATSIGISPEFPIRWTFKI